MRYYHILLFSGMMCLSACGGDGSAGNTGPRQTARLTVLSAPATDSASLAQSGDALTLSVDALSGPCLLQIALPEGQGLADWRWVEDSSSLVTLVLPDTEAGLVEIAATPLGELSAPATLQMTLGTAPRATLGSASSPVQTFGFEVASGNAGNVRLEWQQYIPGDYNFDGVVNLYDVQPLAQYWQQNVDRTSHNARNNPAYWMDGTADGRVDQKDLNLISLNRGLAVYGYGIECNSVKLAGTGTNGVTIPQNNAQHTPGLPPTYSHLCPGRTTDCWFVFPVGRGGGCGLGSIWGGARLEINIDYAGELLPFAGIDAPRFETRVIVPIELIDGADLPVNVVVDDSQISADNVPRSKVLMAEVNYMPAGSNTTQRVTSAGGIILANESKITFPVYIPVGVDELRIDAKLQPETGPYGQPMLRLTTTTTADGGPRQDATVVLDQVERLLRRDTNNNSDVYDELALRDTDSDFVSDALLAHLRQSSGGVRQTGSLQIMGRVVACDIANGTVQLGGVRSPISSQRPPDTMVLRFAEHSRTGLALPLSGLKTGDQLAGNVLVMTTVSGARSYYAESLHLLDAGVTTLTQPVSVTQYWGGPATLRWTLGTGLRGYRVVRSSAPVVSVSVPPGSLYLAAPDFKKDWDRTLGQVSSYVDQGTNHLYKYKYDLYAVSNTGVVSYRGSTP